MELSLSRAARLNRRGFLAVGAGLARALHTRWSRSADGIRQLHLRAVPGQAPLKGGFGPPTAVWSYGSVPGPEIRARQGERLRIVVENGLPEETTVHWHGIRVPNAMDGVPHLTQPPIQTGESFTYEFAVPDAGTYWYHPHARGFEQVARGLAGAFIVEEREPFPADREVTWVLSDWRFLPNGQVSPDFGNMMDVMHDGRVGNTVTVNGRPPEPLAVHSGERLRLRLINAASARTFALRFDEHDPVVIALDGQPVEPHPPEDGQVVLGAAMRADLVIDMTGAPGRSFAVRDTFYEGLEYTLLELAYAAEPVARPGFIGPLASLRPNTMPEPELQGAPRIELRFGGGMGAMMAGGMGGMMSHMNGMMGGAGGAMAGVMAWTINGVTAKGHTMEPFATLERGRTYRFALVNETAWHHPIHLHGHSFRVVARNGQPTRWSEWRDTVLVPPQESAEIAFLADNPGDWMLHCHILDHQEGGMMAVFQVA